MDHSSELLNYIKELTQLRFRITSKQTQEDINKCKLLQKLFAAYYRIMNDSNIMLDTIKNIKLDTTNNSDSKENKMIYMFDDNSSMDSPNCTSSNSSHDDLNELFDENNDAVALSDDEDVAKMERKSTIHLEKILRNKYYQAIPKYKSTSVIIVQSPNQNRIDDYFDDASSSKWNDFCNQNNNNDKDNCIAYIAWTYNKN